MAVGTIHAAKEQPLTFQPLLLATFTFADGTVLRLSTHGLRGADGGFPYAGHDYLPRILNQDIAAVQALSDGGVDVPPQVNLVLNDADQFLWTNYERPLGFKGAKLALTLVTGATLSLFVRTFQPSGHFSYRWQEPNAS